MKGVDQVAWWSGTEKRNRHQLVTQLVKDIQDRNGYRRSLNLHHLRLYADRNVSGMTAGTYARVGDERGFRRPRLSLNVVRNCIDSATSIITRGRPAISFTTEGQWEMQQRAKTRSKFVDAVFYSNDAYGLGQRAFKDAAIFGTGLVKVCRAHGRVVLEKTFPGEVWVDDSEAVYGDPRSFFHVRAVDKAVLAALYPGAAKAIRDAESPDTRIYGKQSIADQALVTEAWHLPSGPNAKDGVCGAYLSSGPLCEKPYRHEAPPFATMRWNEDPLGWWGTGIAYELTGIQYEVNSLVRQAQLGMYSAGNMKFLVPMGSQIERAHVNNDLWATIVKYVGDKPPSFVAPEPLSRTLQDMLQWYVDQAYAITGISQLGARGEIPSGLAGSGRAQLVYKDIESQRFITVQRQYERFFMDLAERVLEAASDLYEDDGDFEVTYVGRNFIERIGFDDVAGDRDEFIVRAQPVSMLPYTMAGKQALADDAVAKGYIDQNAAKKIAGWGDLVPELDLATAPIDLIDERLERMLTKGEYLGPHPRMDLQLAVQRATLTFQRAELDGAPPDRLELVGQFIDECHDQIAIAEEALAADQAAAAPPAPAPSMPMMAPTMPEIPPEMGVAA